MGLINPTIPTLGQPNVSEDADIVNAFTAIVVEINGLLNAANITDGTLTATELETALQQQLGVSGGGVTRRGKSIVATEEARTNVAYGLLTTPDRVSGVVLPTDGLIVVAYQAMWKSSVANAGSAALFLGANELKIARAPLAAPTAPDWPITTNTADRYAPLFTRAAYGLFSDPTQNPAYTGDVTTGQIMGQFGQTGSGAVAMFAAAGTHDVSVQFKASSGSVTAKNRKLWVWTLGF